MRSRRIVLPRCTEATDFDVNVSRETSRKRRWRWRDPLSRVRRDATGHLSTSNVSRGTSGPQRALGRSTDTAGESLRTAGDLPHDREMDLSAFDLLNGPVYRWRGAGAWNYVMLDPALTPAHVFRVGAPLRPPE